jgi:hypothetical protein
VKLSANIMLNIHKRGLNRLAGGNKRIDREYVIIKMSIVRNILRESVNVSANALTAKERQSGL